MVSTSPRRTTTMAIAGAGLVAALFAGAVAPASAAPTGGLLDLGSATDYSVLAATEVTNTGTTTVTGNLGIWPGTALTGFGSPSKIGGTVRVADNAAEQAQRDTAAAYIVAAALPTTSAGHDELSGQTLTPGVYAGGAMALSDNNVLTLNGSANSLWIFQASSSLTIGSGSRVAITGGASACNVFWQVGSSATIGTGAEFQGTVLAGTAITAATNATITGRLLARTAAVTLDSDSINTPNCAPASAVPGGTQAPTITSGQPVGAAMVGAPFAHTVTASGTPVPTFTLSAGALPAGLVLDGTSGVISGTPTTAGSSTFTVSVGNGIGQNATAEYTLTIAAVKPPPLLGTPVPGTPALPGTPVVPGLPVVPGTPALPGAPLPEIAAPVETPAATPRPAPVSAPAATPAGPQGAPTAGSQPRGTAKTSTGTALAETGSNVTPILVAGGVILLAGAALVTVVGIRRRQARTGRQ